MSKRRLKGTLFSFSLLMLLSSAVAGERGSLQKAFEEAGVLYEKEDYSETIKSYEKILSEDASSGSLYYNLGNAYFKSGDLGRAILNYERALKLSPGDKELTHNLSFVRELLQDRIEPPESPRWLQKLASFHRLLTVTVVALLISLFYSIILLFASYAVVQPSFRPVFFRVFLVPLLSVFIFFLGLGLFKVMEERFSPAVVVAEEIDVHYGPSTHETKAFVLHAGTKCAVRESSGGWVLIWLSNDRGGWVEKSGIERI